MKLNDKNRTPNPATTNLEPFDEGQLENTERKLPEEEDMEPDVQPEADAKQKAEEEKLLNKQKMPGIKEQQEDEEDFEGFPNSKRQSIQDDKGDLTI